MILLRHFSKKSMQEELIGKNMYEMQYSETSIFGEELTYDCTTTGAHRPLVTGHLTRFNPKTGKLVKSKEFYATITVKNGIITKIT